MVNLCIWIHLERWSSYDQKVLFLDRLAWWVPVKGRPCHSHHWSSAIVCIIIFRGILTQINKTYPLRMVGFICIKSCIGFSHFPVLSWSLALKIISNNKHNLKGHTKDASSSNVEGITVCFTTCSLLHLVKSSHSSSLLLHGNLWFSSWYGLKLVLIMNISS